MFKLKSVPLLLGCIILALLGCGSSNDETDARSKSTDDAVLLKLAFKEGDQRKLVSETKTSATMTANDKSQELKSSFGVEITFRVKSVDPEGAHTVDITWDRVWLKFDPIRLGAAEIDYDSATSDSKEDLDSIPMAGFVGKTITAIFQSTGSVSEVQGSDELFASMGESASSIKEELSNILPVFSSNPVKVEDNWSLKRTMTMGDRGQLEADITYTLRERKNGESIAKVEGKLSGAQSGTLEGTVYVDEKTGWTNRAEHSIKLKGQQGPVQFTMEHVSEIRTNRSQD